MFYTIAIAEHEMIASSKDPGVARYWAVQYTKETGGRAVVVEGIEFYESGRRVQDKDVDLERFKG